MKAIHGLALFTSLALGCGRTMVGDLGAPGLPVGGAATSGGAPAVGGTEALGGARAGGGAAAGGGGPSMPPLGLGGGVLLGPGVPGPVTLAPGTCGVRRAIELPSTPEARSAVVTRQAGGFAVGPWKSGDAAEVLNGVFIADNGHSRMGLTAFGALNDLAWSVLMADRHLDVEVYVAPGDAPLVDHFNTRFWAPANHAPTLRAMLLDAQWRGTDEALVQPSLDGKVAVFALWPLAIGEPQAAVIGTDATRVGAVLRLAPAGHRLGQCPLVVPTEHAGLISYFDPDEAALRVSQLEPDGSVSLNELWPMPNQGHVCPLFSVDAAGPGFIVDKALDGQPPRFSLYRLGADGGASETPIALASSPLAWTTTNGGVLILENGPAGYSLELQTPTGPQVFALPNVGSQLRPFYAEPGSIYVDSGVFGEPRNLLELTCG